MQALISPLEELECYNKIKKKIVEPIKAGIFGCVDSQKLHMIYGLSSGRKRKVIITYSDEKAKEIYQDYQIYDRKVMYFPTKDLMFFQADIHGNQLTKERIKVLRRLVEGRPYTIVTTFAALMTLQVIWNEADIISLDKSSKVEAQAIAQKLVAMGYEKNYQVEAPGQFSVRGGIIDVFDLTEENPYRIELWGDEIESIRSFDILSQRSIEQLSSLQIWPAKEFVLSQKQMKIGLEKIEEESSLQIQRLKEKFLTEEAHRLACQMKEMREQLLEFQESVNLENYIRYFCENIVSLADLCIDNLFFIDEPEKVLQHANGILQEFRESMSHRVEKGYLLPSQIDILYSVEEIIAKLQKNTMIGVGSFPFGETNFGFTQIEEVRSKTITSYHHSFESLLKDLVQYRKKGYRVLLMSGSRTRAKRLAQDLRDNEIAAVYSEDPMREIIPGEVLAVYGHVDKGFEYPEIKFVCLTESDIFGAEKKKKNYKKYKGKKIQNLDELKVGDYIVHKTHGIGIYQGIEKVEVDHIIKDCIKVEYGAGANLYIFATGLDMIQKYATTDVKKPKLNRLGSKEWIKTKTKVREAIGEVAEELVQLYATRQQLVGHPYGKDTVWQKEFEEMFPYEETEDQLMAIEDIKKDMESTKIMDRLICGDVGYGKTEIAIRAAFKAIQEGKQVVYLVPTTILAQQHFNTFKERMQSFPIGVELLSRFRSSSEIKRTLSDLKKGQVDIVIGTHRVLSSDVEFKDLGMLIIDEEQRFGVKHKEKIKQMKDSVDVLALSATPIPRTLHMSLIGIRDMSVLEEPPRERLPIQTFVMEYNEEMVREAIVREVSRNGQVYYVYNRVNNIHDIAATLQKLVPEARVSFAHGQMKESELERIMLDFINHEIDILVSTTIIETGLDISNVNTIIIHDSDKMGLSQLYQLRGRVGRSNRIAYAFLLYKRDTILREVAEKRLAAIKEFTELGSGYKIAMRDLEIRGAGNLLGQKQHGHMEAVGYDMYCNMLNDAVATLKGIKKVEEFDTTVEIDVDAFIPPTYIVNEVQKLDIYKRIANIDNVNEKEDMEDELLDRFGEVPKSVENLLRIALIRVKSHRLYITEVKGKKEKIMIKFLQDAKINPVGIPSIMQKYKKALAFDIQNMQFIYEYKKTNIMEKDAKILLELIEALLEDLWIYLGE